MTQIESRYPENLGETTLRGIAEKQTPLTDAITALEGLKTSKIHQDRSFTQTDEYQQLEDTLDFLRGVLNLNKTGNHLDNVTRAPLIALLQEAGLGSDTILAVVRRCFS